jgi:hypothetical protein
MRKHLPNLPAVVTNVTILIAVGTAVPQPVRGQGAQATPVEITVGGVKLTGVPNDWSTRHLVFSNPGTEQEAIANGKHDQWLRIVNEPRYIIQQLQRHAPVQGPAAAQIAALEVPPAGLSATQTTSAAEPDKRRKIQKDWSEAMGSNEGYGANMFPAKWSFSTTTASCSDFVVFPTGSEGSATTATIMAYTNLYGTGCSGTVPAVYWAYNTGTGYDAGTSPIFSASGSQVAFVQYDVTSPYTTQLVLLTFAASATQTFAAPQTLTAVATSSYVGCGAPCMTTITFSSSGTDLGWSSPFYDYTSDSLWVAGNNGLLHKFSPVFNGTPAEVVGSGWPVTLNASYIATSPVYDPTSGCVFVGNLDGILYSVESGNPGTVCTSTSGSRFAYSATYNTCGGTNTGITDGPLVDSSAESVYAFVENYHSGSTYYDAALQFPASFSGSGTAASVIADIGDGPRQDSSNSTTCSSGIGVPAGAFDNVYLESSTSTSPSGHIYVVGNTELDPTLYQLAITNNMLSATAVTGPQLQSAGYVGSYNSPVTEFCNNSGSACVSNGTSTTSGTDYLFVSSFYGKPTACAGTSSTGCIMSFTVSTPSSFSSSMTPNTPLTVAASGLPTIGMVIDNSSTFAGASQFYFATVDASGTCATSGGTGFCAVQASQAAP